MQQVAGELAFNYAVREFQETALEVELHREVREIHQVARDLRLAAGELNQAAGELELMNNADGDLKHTTEELIQAVDEIEGVEDDVGENEDIEQGVEEEVYDEVRELEKLEGELADIEIQHQFEELEKFAQLVERLEDDVGENEEAEQGVEEEVLYDEVNRVGQSKRSSS